MPLPGWIDKVTDVLSRKRAPEWTPPPVPPAPGTQAAYDAKMVDMNKNNPHFKNVDNSGLTKEPIGGQ
jgi:hypothetical protein